VIGSLRGSLRLREAGRIVVDVNGVGYVVHVAMSTFLALPEVGREVDLLIDTQVREDSITLYGFRDPVERQLFERLLTVSGVGPRTALAALSALGAESVAEAITDLRDRLAALAPTSVAANAVGPRGDAADVTSALVNLGYPEKQVARAVSDALKEAGKGDRPAFDELLRNALKRLGRVG